ncbi:peptidylprolyl isomerase fpr3, partial [Coemansia sp. RSA 2559]
IKEEGTGQGVKKGARVGMYYIGKLTNGKVFDKNVKGKPLWFRLGAGEVIKGWDVGIVGMKKGGERRLTIPAAMAYGKRGAPPDIPANATLVFDIRLVDFK